MSAPSVQQINRKMTELIEYVSSPRPPPSDKDISSNMASNAMQSSLNILSFDTDTSQRF